MSSAEKSKSGNEQPDPALVSNLCDSLAPGSNSEISQTFAGTVLLEATVGDNTKLASFSGTLAPGECIALPLGADGWQAVRSSISPRIEFVSVVANSDGMFRLSTAMLTSSSSSRTTSSADSTSHWDVQHVAGSLLFQVDGGRDSGSACRGREALPATYALLLVYMLLALANRFHRL